MKSNRANCLLFSCLVVVCTTLSMIYWTTSLQLGLDLIDIRLWQLITAHFVHYDWQHLIKNLLALGFLLYLFPLPNQNLIKGFILALVLIDVYLLLSDVKFYVGFSGLLYVVLGMVMGRLLQVKKFVILMCCLVVIYVYIFQFSNVLHPSKGIMWYSLKEGHLLGLFAGFVVTIFKTNINKWRIKGTKPPIRTNLYCH